MIIGAGHTELVLKLLNEGGMSYAQITPRALNPSYGNLTEEAFERKNQLKWARISLGTLGSLLNKKKPQPVVERPTAKSYASMYLASVLLGEVTSEVDPSQDRTAGFLGYLKDHQAWNQLNDLPEFRLDEESITRDENDIIFRAWLKDTNNEEEEVWARVGKLNTPNEARSIEEKLKQAIVDLGGDGIDLPPTDPPSNSDRAEEEGPGDGKRNGVLITRVNQNTVALFAGTKAVVQEAARLSG